MSFAQGFREVVEHPDRRDGREGGHPYSCFAQVGGSRRTDGRREVADSVRVEGVSHEEWELAGMSQFVTGRRIWESSFVNIMVRDSSSSVPLRDYGTITELASCQV